MGNKWGLLHLLGWTPWNCQYCSILTYRNGYFIWLNLIWSSLPSFFLPSYSPKTLQVFFLGLVAQSFLWLTIKLAFLLLSLSWKAFSLFEVSKISSSENTIRFNLSSKGTLKHSYQPKSPVFHQKRKLLSCAPQVTKFVCNRWTASQLIEVYWPWRGR